MDIQCFTVMPPCPAAAPPGAPRRLLDAVRERVRNLHDSLRTEEAYVHWVLGQLLDGTGLRITEALQLRVKDVDFDRRAIVVRAGKGGKDRVVMLPAVLAPELHDQLRRARTLWDADARAGRGGVQLPDALERKYPRAGASWAWFWVLPQAEHSACPRTGVEQRHHLLLRLGGGAVTSPLDALGQRPPAVREPRTDYSMHRVPLLSALSSAAVASDQRTRRRSRRGASQRATAPATMLGQCRLGQRVQPATGGIALDLRVPGGSVEGGKPRSKSRQNLWRQQADLVFERFELFRGQG